MRRGLNSIGLYWRENDQGLTSMCRNWISQRILFSVWHTSCIISHLSSGFMERQPLDVHISFSCYFSYFIQSISSFTSIYIAPNIINIYIITDATSVVHNKKNVQCWNCSLHHDASCGTARVQKYVKSHIIAARVGGVWCLRLWCATMNFCI